MEGEAKDAGLISAAERVEHYEMAAYGTAPMPIFSESKQRLRFCRRL
jgi:Domain of unknown function (DUF892)